MSSPTGVSMMSQHPTRKHFRQSSRDAHNLWDELVSDIHADAANAVSSPTEVTSKPRRTGQPQMCRQSTGALLEKLDEREQLVDQLLKEGAAMLAPDDKMSSRAISGDLSEQSTDIGECSDAESDSNMSSWEESYSARNSPRGTKDCSLWSTSGPPSATKLMSDVLHLQSRVAAEKFDLSLAAEKRAKLAFVAKELKLLHAQLTLARKQLSGAQIERLSKTLEVLSNGVRKI
jgi:hypothetical protein